MKRIALILMLLAIAVTMAAAQQRSRLVQSLSYSGVELKLGDPEEATIQQLRKLFTLKGAMETLKNQGSCAVDSGSVQEPNYLNQSGSVICGNKSVQVTATESSQLPNKTTVNVYEWLIDFSPN